MCLDISFVELTTHLSYSCIFRVALIAVVICGLYHVFLLYLLYFLFSRQRLLVFGGLLLTMSCAEVGKVRGLCRDLV